MKKNTLFLFFLLLFLSCEKDVQFLDVNSTDKETELPQNDVIDYHQIIANLGFDEETSLDKGNYFLVEGDIMLTKDQLASYKENAHTRQARWNYIVSFEKKFDIRIKLMSNIPDLWKSAIRNAINNWNTLPGLYMYEVSNGYADIEISMYGSSYDSYIASASFPSSEGLPGPTIYINPYYSNNYNSGQANLIMTHEIGHCIGFRHTNWRVRESSQPAIAIPGTPDSGSNPDPSSIMNWDVAIQGRSWSGFSSNDTYATKVLYGEPYISGPNFVCICGSQTFKLENIPSNATVKWSNRIFSSTGGYLSPDSHTGNPYLARSKGLEKKRINLYANVKLPNGYDFTFNKSLDTYSHSGAYIEQYEYDFELRNYGNIVSDTQWSAPEGIIHMKNWHWAFIEFPSTGPYVVQCTYINPCGARITVTKDDVMGNR